MSKILIEGGRQLNGEVNIHGSKNAVLPILAATVLNTGKNVIHNCPKLKDVYSSVKILKYLGCSALWDDNTLIVDSSNIENYYIPENLMREMRSSIVFLGAIIARCHNAKISMPGGCELGPRPIDLHIKAFKQLGVKFNESHGYIDCCLDKIKCDHIHLDFPSVGATENIMLLSVFGEGITTISNAAKEPEIIDLQNYLNAMGAKVYGAGGNIVKIDGVKTLHDVEHTVIPDRIVATSYLSAVGITGGNIKVSKVIPEHLQPTISVLKDCGIKIFQEQDCIIADVQTRPKQIDFLRTLPHPGFPTDAQAPIMSLLAIADGTSIVAENMFENRFKHSAELNRMGADIKIDGRIAVIRGVKRLSGAKVTATDLRGAAALIIAGLNAEGLTEVDNLDHLDRGYENFEIGLKNLGADIKRIK